MSGVLVFLSGSMLLTWSHGYIIPNPREPVCGLFECQNDGVLQEGDCSCDCGHSTAGLLCQTELQPSDWPDGQYAIPTSIYGCPEDENRKWSLLFLNLTLPTEGMTNHQWNDDNSITVEPHLLGPYHTHSVQINFCLKDGLQNETEIWPAGQYCVYKFGNICPAGFDEGAIKMSGYAIVSSIPIGYSPVNISNGSITLMFCCRSDDNTTNPLLLPNTYPFYLFRMHQSSACQIVEGMDVKEEMFYFVDDQSQWTFKKPHPHIHRNKDNLGLAFCFYYPKVRQECFFRSDSGFSYNGRKMTTKSGTPCMFWADAGKEFQDSKLWKGEFEENFCRKFDNNGNEPVCYNNITSQFEECGLPECAENTDLETVGEGKPVYAVGHYGENLPEFAADGNIFGVPFTSTRPMVKPYIQIDLEKFYYVHAVQIHRMHVWFPVNFRHAAVYVSKNRWDFLNYGAFQCNTHRNPRKAKQFRFQCLRPIVGQYVAIRNFDLTGPNTREGLFHFLEISEVIVYGKATGCGRPLGVTSGEIRDFQLTASTEGIGSLADQARLLNMEAGWCSSNMDDMPNIMVDLIVPLVVQGIIVQGWEEASNIKFIQRFSISYALMQGREMDDLDDVDGTKMIFNIDQSLSASTPQKFYFPTEILGRFVKINILQFSDFACLKMELIGCPKRVERDLTCATDSFDFGWEEQSHRGFWMEEDSWLTNITSIDDCRDICSDNDCVSLHYNKKDRNCLLHDGHRYNRHYSHWWLDNLASSSYSSQPLCLKDVNEMETCGMSVSDAQLLKSPGYPFYYGQNVVCHWNITVPNNTYIQIEVIDIDLAEPTSTSALREAGIYTVHVSRCSDTLTLSSAEDSKASFKSEEADLLQNVKIVSSSNHIDVFLQSCKQYARTSARGFVLNVTLSEYPGCGVEDLQCHTICEAPSAYISTIGFPSHYSDLDSCYWRIHGYYTQYVHLESLHLDVPNTAETCSESHVSVYDIALDGERHLLDRFCNTHRPYGKLKSSWHWMDVEFHAGSFLTGTGFMALYKLQTFQLSYDNNSTVVCDSEWTGYGENCYRLMSVPLNLTDGLTWIEAEHSCQQNDGHLVSISDRDEMTFIHVMMSMEWKVGLGTNAYIGLQKKKGRDLLTDYEWSDNKPLTYTSWYSDAVSGISQPDGLMNERCSVIRMYSIHSMTNWHDIACAYSKVRDYICEQENHGKHTVRLFDELKKWSDPVLQKENVFTCNSGEYISRLFVCDKQLDCSDGSDELQCGDSCSDSSFTCGDGGCISASLFCDFIHQCEDGSDEIDCVHPNCTGDHWRCQNGQCISGTNRCDLKPDCIDHSDEENCEKCPSRFQCYDEKCIPLSRLCDGHVDCAGMFNEDEDSCTNNVRYSCADWWAIGMKDTGKYLINAGYRDSFPVECKFHGNGPSSIGVTTLVHHKSEEPLTHEISELNHDIVYAISLEHIERLKSLADCKQYLNINCHYTDDTKDIWWEGADHKQYRIISHDNCSCPFLQLCESDVLRKCECSMAKRDWYSHDQNDWLTDHGYITNTDSLPILSVHVSYLGSLFLEKVTIQIGPLICEESVPDMADSLLCRNSVTVNAWVLCVLDFDQYGDIIGCRDLSHLELCAEHECRPGYVKCPDTYCIPVRFLCDGIQNCPHGEDETICENVTNSGYFSCHGSNVMLPTFEVCDDVRHCPDGDDEALCHIACHASCLCDGLTISCPSISTENYVIPLSVRKLDISDNFIFANNLTLSHYVYLAELNLSSTGLVVMPAGKFHSLNNLRVLDLSHNLIEKIVYQTFDGLFNLHRLYLHGNKHLLIIEPFAFFGLLSLPALEIQYTQIKKLSKHTFRGLQSLTSLNMTNNMIFSVDDKTFEGLEYLYSLDLTTNMIEDFSSGMFKGLSKLTELHTDSYVFCCIRPKTTSETSCFPYKNEFSSCSDLMRNEVLRISLWVVGFMALAGNFFVLVYRTIFDRRSLKKASNVYVSNLALSDFLMGIYLIIIASADMYYRDIYIWNDVIWRKSDVCKLAGIISILSTESTIMFLCMITIDRVISIKFPFGHFRMTGKTAWLISIIIWIIFISISVLPIMPIWYFHGVFYSRSPVCLALPLTQTSAPGWEYATGVYIIFNFVAFLFIAGGQTMVYKTINDVEECIKSQRKTADLVIARNLFIIALTDFICWFPICVMGIMALTGHMIPGEVYTWTSVFILPINSALNPFLYTIGTIIKQHGKVTYFRSSINSSTGNVIIDDKWSDIWNSNYFISTKNLKPYVKLRDFVERRGINTRSIYCIIHKITEIVDFLHERRLSHGCINEDTVCVLPDENIPGMSPIFDISLILDTLDKTSRKHSEDIVAIGQLTKTLLAKRSRLASNDHM